MALVKTIQLGPTTVTFHDDYCKDKTPEDVRKILDHIAEITYPHLCEKARKEAEKQQETG